MSAIAHQAETPPLVLASGSSARRDLLAGCGLRFLVQPADIDEHSIKRRMRADGATASDAAMTLAENKAIVVSRARPADLVIGADQILTCGKTWYDKPPDLVAARRQLAELRGQTQRLHTACALATGAHVVWRGLAEPMLRMRSFSDAALDAYLVAEGEAVCSSVGACRIEGPGYQLFDAIEGEHAAILGLPLLALLGELRHRGILLA